MSSENLELLLAFADSHQPVAPQGLPLESATLVPRDPPQETEETHLWDPGGDPNSLPAQRWGLVVPEGPEGERLLALVEPLRQQRQEDQEGNPVLIYRVPRSLQVDAEGRRDAFSQWKRAVLDDESIPVDDRPRYLLFLGDFDQVPFELQQTVAGDTLVGRLAFRRERDYESYVDKVLRWESEPSSESEARALFFTAHDGSAATTIGYRTLMAPGLASLREARELGRFQAREVLEIGGPEDVGMNELLEQARRGDPAVLFSMSHGLGSPRGGWHSTDEKLALQGAMNLGGGEHLDAEVVAHQPFLPGGIWFYFACFGAGTPSRSAFQHWLRRLQASGQFGGRLDSITASLPREGEKPFVAALPQAVLANPHGPLAVIGHVDLAWTYGFQDRDSRRGKTSRFMEPLHQLVKGRRAGLGLEWLLRGYNQANVELTTLMDLQESAGNGGSLSSADLTQRAHLWMLRQDLSGYILLGDPAVRLPLSAKKRGQARRG